MKNIKKILVSISAAALLFSCSDDIDTTEDSVSFEEIANSKTSDIYFFQEGKTPIGVDVENLDLNSPVEAEDQRSNARPVHAMRVVELTENSSDDPDSPAGVFSFERNRRIGNNTSYNARTNQRTGRGRFSNRSIRPNSTSISNFNTRTAGVWVSGNGRRGVYAGRITRINESVFEFDGVAEESPVVEGALYITYFRVNAAGDMFTGSITAILPPDMFTDDEVIEEIFPGGDFAFGAIPSATLPSGEVITLPPFGANQILDDNSIVNLRRRNN